MKLRRALAAAAATAVIAPAALLAAPAAYANENDNGGTDTTQTQPDQDTDGQDADDTSGSDSSDGTGNDGTGDESTEGGTEGEKSETPDTEAPDTEAPDTEKPEGEVPDAEKPEGEKKPDETPEGEEPEEEKPGEEDGPWLPFDCEKLDLDSKLSATITGLPNTVVAGSGWHNFEFTVENGSKKTLKNVYVEAFAEYTEDDDENPLALDLAELQYKNPENGKWTDSYQAVYEDENGDTAVTGTFVGIIDQIDPKASVEMQLRVRIDAAAPAGSSLAVTNAVYAGKGKTCHGNGDAYEFTVAKAGSKPDKVEDAKPSGEKPQGGAKKPLDGKKQSESKELPVDGKLAETGSSSALPMFALAGGAAVALGAGAMFVVRRRKGAGTDTSAVA
ncbi:LAETG motif-containing sortase-dependent surface protein [Streptomyces sp. TRM 70361]|uniref:LAETG motif-containing sortase-dependent surface protein n=1 Tax=Streptomyces sp. TRM 70361 TaxID=3116553 RepID=UPI002E7B0EB9|nr:LAETG motif-containing sortase-dependent surface protein [Streptomyces sp. TRM 70361]MEE1940601.1 LAETG motif-containing sortase-dependent surface protein [Streptomyces sp. TRM 70361]